MSEPNWAWRDIEGVDRPEDVRVTLTMRLDNYGALFVPKPRKVFVVVGGVRHGPYEIVGTLADAGPALVAGMRRHRRLSRMRSAYRRRKR